MTKGISNRACGHTQNMERCKVFCLQPVEKTTLNMSLHLSCVAKVCAEEQMWTITYVKQGFLSVCKPTLYCVSVWSAEMRRLGGPQFSFASLYSSISFSCSCLHIYVYHIF